MSIGAESREVGSVSALCRRAQASRKRVELLTKASGAAASAIKRAAHTPAACLLHHIGITESLANCHVADLPADGEPSGRDGRYPSLSTGSYEPRLGTPPLVPSESNHSPTSSDALAEESTIPSIRSGGDGFTSITFTRSRRCRPLSTNARRTSNPIRSSCCFGTIGVYVDWRHAIVKDCRSLTDSPQCQ
jgi:hypothetical protein